ncbi:hypothetical protein GA0115245_129213 [Streptomyces sp. di188]|nr:hypothetical protein GA0115245_129213 [Streptomyces sp. di188]
MDIPQQSVVSTVQELALTCVLVLTDQEQRMAGGTVQQAGTGVL